MARGTQGAARGGVLVEIAQAPYDRLPHDDDAFDVVVVNDLVAGLSPERRAGCLREARRVLRPGGRLVLIEKAGRGGLGALFSRRQQNPHYVASGGAEPALKAEQFVAVRTLVERAGLRFVEAVRPR